MRKLTKYKLGTRLQSDVLWAALRYRLGKLLPFISKESDSNYLYWSMFIGGVAENVVSGQSEEDAVRNEIARIARRPSDADTLKALNEYHTSIERSNIAKEGELCAEMAFRLLLHITKDCKGLNWKMWNRESKKKLKEMKRDYWHKKWCSLREVARA